ncbi:acyloxyacyl hydrolase [Nonlabens ponticola]|uniref:Acyloxyacyl hydrolase n=2 Tax=Nonlabens ponticola TaxID=2496866 RepID=A0A3S9MWI3_9FLAO|nr:acyloxyacyl hydrolase [Nonlabens ponticola]
MLLVCYALPVVTALGQAGFAKAGFSQSNSNSTSNDKNLDKIFTIDASYLYGTILQHNPDISHLITDHPTAILLSYNRKTYGGQEWQSRYNFPDYGFSFAYQDMKNRFLGEAYGAYAHYNFYFFNRNMQFRVGQGISYMTRPFDVDSNPQNNAYGTRLTSSTYLLGNYRKENLFHGFGFQVGASIIHYSNANVRAPNNSTNTWLFNAGVNYTFNHEEIPEYKIWPKRKYTEPIGLTAVARLGFNESDYRGSGQYPFYDFSVYLDKRINIKSSLHAGLELFIAEFLKEYRDYRVNSFPEDDIDGDENFQRAGIFVGHELHLGKTSLLSQLGYYYYQPIPFESRFYNRLGLQRRLTDNIFASVTVKAHGAKAEGVSLGIGYRFENIFKSKLEKL